MINYDNFVNVSEIARQAKKAGEFIMFKCQSGNLLVTNKFIISLTFEQFFKLQCKLEIPELGIWYLKGKNLPERSDREVDLLKLESSYNDWLSKPCTEIINTRLILCEQFAIYTDHVQYVAIPLEQIGMIQSPQVFRDYKKYVSIDAFHIITRANDKIFDESEYLTEL